MKKFIAILLVLSAMLTSCKIGGQTPLQNSSAALKTEGIEYKSYTAWANYSDSSDIITSCLNFNKMHISSVRHCPIFRLDSKGELEDFKEKFKKELNFSQSYDEVSSFEQIALNFTEEHFEKNTVFVVYVSASSGSNRYAVDSVYIDEESFIVHAKRVNNPEVYTCDMAGWFLLVDVKKADIKECSSFDADLDNI